jgi:hypothetical protein
VAAVVHRVVMATYHQLLVEVVAVVAVVVA